MFTWVGRCVWLNYSFHIYGPIGWAPVMRVKTSFPPAVTALLPVFSSLQWVEFRRRAYRHVMKWSLFGENAWSTRSDQRKWQLKLHCHLMPLAAMSLLSILISLYEFSFDALVWPNYFLLFVYISLSIKLQQILDSFSVFSGPKWSKFVKHRAINPVMDALQICVIYTWCGNKKTPLPKMYYCRRTFLPNFQAVFLK